MNQSCSRWLACLLILSAAAMLSAQETPRPLGRILILDNERVLEGEIERQGDYYLIRRSVGELKVPAKGVLSVCSSMTDAYAFLSARTNQRDANERMRLARWCQSNGLLEQALVEVHAAHQLQPQRDDAKQLLMLLERPATPAQLPPAGSETLAPPTPLPPSLEVTGDCLVFFTTKVQPILMNACANCHTGGRGGAFSLTRLGGGIRATTQSNLAAAIKQISFEKPSASPLVQKAGCAHGGVAQAALPLRESPAFQNLAGWVDMVVAQNPQLKLHGSPAIAKEQLPPAVQPFSAKNIPPETDNEAFAGSSPPSPTPPNAGAGPMARPIDITASTKQNGGSEPVAAPRAFDSAQPRSVQLDGPYDPRPFNEMVRPAR